MIVSINLSFAPKTSSMFRTVSHWWLKSSIHLHTRSPSNLGPGSSPNSRYSWNKKDGIKSFYFIHGVNDFKKNVFTVAKIQVFFGITRNISHLASVIALGTPGAQFFCLSYTASYMRYDLSEFPSLVSSSFVCTPPHRSSIFSAEGPDIRRWPSAFQNLGCRPFVLYDMTHTKKNNMFCDQKIQTKRLRSISRTHIHLGVFLFPISRWG